MESSTKILRRLLDERGVKHEGGERSVRWRDRNGVIMQAFPLASGELGLDVWSCTPEQAIAATLDDIDATGGRQGDAGTCENTQDDADFMCSVCGKCVDNGRILGFNYCPNCGRKVVTS